MTELKWRRTWPPDPGARPAEDWTVRLPGDGYCRVYERPDGRWYWVVAEAKTLGSGVVATKEEAMAAAKATWQEEERR